MVMNWFTNLFKSKTSRTVPVRINSKTISVVVGTIMVLSVGAKILHDGLEESRKKNAENMKDPLFALIYSRSETVQDSLFEAKYAAELGTPEGIETADKILDTLGKEFFNKDIDSAITALDKSGKLVYVADTALVRERHNQYIAARKAASNARNEYAREMESRKEQLRQEQADSAIARENRAKEQEILHRNPKVYESLGKIMQEEQQRNERAKRARK